MVHNGETTARKKLARLCGCLAISGAMSAFAAADIAWKYDTSGRTGTIVEPTAGTAQAFASFDSTSSQAARASLSVSTVLVEYFNVFNSNVAEILTQPPGIFLIVR